MPALAQIRVIATTDRADALITRLTVHARSLYGSDASYRVQVRSASRIGHVRAYLTITTKEEPT